MESEQWKHHYIDVNGIRLHYVEQGAGPLVILLHGFPEFWYSWRNQIPVLAQHFRVVAPDMRGYGDSDKPKGVKHYHPNTVAQDIHDLILALGEEKAHIVGHDWGGGISWQLAQHFPQVVNRLVVLNCPFMVTLLKHMVTNPSQIRKSWYIYFFQLPGLPEYRMKKDLKGFFKVALRGWSKEHRAFTDEDIDKYVEAYSQPGAITGPVNYYRASARNMFNSSINKIVPITADTLVLWGEEDKALGKELTYGMEKHFTNHFEIKYIPECSHWIQHDKAELVNEELLHFLQLNTVPNQ